MLLEDGLARIEEGIHLVGVVESGEAFADEGGPYLEVLLLEIEILEP